MHFLSIEWLIIMLFTIALFWIAPFKYRQSLLSAITIVVLATYSPISLAILTTLTVPTFFSVGNRSRPLSGFAAILVIVINIAVLLFYKYQTGHYYNSDSISSIIIPLGLAYYTLRLVHYIIEAYKGSLPSHTFMDFINYQFFLPTIVVGPIHRFSEFNKDLRRHHWDFSMIALGSERILYGYVKLTFLANYLISGVFANVISTCGQATDPLVIYLTMIKAGLNLYMQFSGFSDIAIGFAKILGFNVMENFKWPYFQKNISDFWRCWHISLTSWCRDYIFNSVTAITRSPALGSLSTMVIIGVWHELSIRFIVWGLYHGLGIVIWQKFQKIKTKMPQLPRSFAPFTHALSVLLTLHFVWFGFNIVNYPTLPEAFNAMFTVLFFFRG